jgi:TolB-like protein
LKFFTELKERRFAQFLTAYGAGSWIVLEAIDQLIGNEVLPTLLYPIALTLAIAGLPAVVIVSWFHGAKGQQESSGLERVLLGLVAVVALGATGYVARGELAADVTNTAAVLERLDPTEDPRRIAVLYFDAAGEGNEQQALAAGITETLIDELSDVQALHVVSRNGVSPLRGRSDFRSDSIGAALGVGTLVQGRVRESDSIVQVNVSLEKAKTGTGIGSTSLEAPRSQLFRLQADIAQQVAEFLREEIGEEIQLISGQARAENVDAWLLVQEAAEKLEQASRLSALEDAESAEAAAAEADAMLAEAEGLAPRWSVPPTRRGWLAYQRSRTRGFDREEVATLIAEGMDHANRALGLDEADADALELRATLNYWRYLLNLTSEPGEAEELFANAERDFNAAVAANPEQASALGSLSHLLMNKGSTAQAKLAAEQSYEADPWLTNANTTLYRLFSSSLDLGDAREAPTWCREGARRFQEDSRFKECQVWLLALPGQEPDSVVSRIDDSWRLCGEYVELSQPEEREFRTKRCQMAIAWALVRADLPDSALAVAARARAGVDVDPVRELVYFEAFVHAWLGDIDQAIDNLAVYLAANPSQVESFARDRTWWLEDVRPDSRYQALVRAP